MVGREAMCVAGFKDEFILVYDDGYDDMGDEFVCVVLFCASPARFVFFDLIQSPFPEINLILNSPIVY